MAIRDILKAKDDALSLIEPSDNRDECELIILRACVRYIEEEVSSGSRVDQQRASPPSG